MHKIAFAFFSVALIHNACICATTVASAGYVNQSITTHATDTTNPHSVTAAQVGLGNLKNIDTTNADNITSGTIAYERMPIGTSENTIAAGDDVRFYALPTSQPDITAPSNMVLVWFE